MYFAYLCSCRQEVKINLLPMPSNALVTSISSDRLAKYHAHSTEHLGDALALYEWNMRCSSAFYEVLHILEVCMRNRLDAALSEAYDERWLASPSTAPLNDYSLSAIVDAQRSLAPNAPRGNLIAELKFAFWVGLLNQSYDKNLWRRAAFRAFGAQGGRARRIVHQRINAIRRLRNRIAHHEPVFDRDLAAFHQEVLKVIDWMCPETANWARSVSQVEAVLAARPRFEGKI